MSEFAPHIRRRAGTEPRDATGFFVMRRRLCD